MVGAIRSDLGGDSARPTCHMARNGPLHSNVPSAAPAISGRSEGPCQTSRSP